VQDKNGGGYNGKSPENKEEDNVINIPTLAERDKIRRKKEKEEKKWRKEYRKSNPKEPIFNLPLCTKFFLFLLITVHLFSELILTPESRYTLFETLGFVPSNYTGGAAFNFLFLVSPFTYVLIHANWTHFLMNSIMLTAFGAGLEKWIGGKRMLVFFILCSLTSAFLHLLLNPGSSAPMVGASGGLSGMFAAILLLMQSKGIGATGKYGIWPFAILWVLISFFFGSMGMPGNETIAWAAHIGGFAAGFIFLKPVLKHIN
jgi:membrane associated rhomboid family serine protease